MSMCRVFCSVVGRGSFLWPVCSLGKPLLAFALLHSVLQGQNCLLLQMFLDFLLLHSSLLWRKEHLFGVLVLEGLHRIVQLQLLQHYWLGHRLGLLWYWVVCLGNEQRSFCHFEIVYQHTVVTVPQWCCQTTKHRTSLISHPCGSALLIAQGLLLCLGQASHYLIQVGLNWNDQDNMTWLWSSQVAPGMLTSWGPCPCAVASHRTKSFLYRIEPSKANMGISRLSHKRQCHFCLAHLDYTLSESWTAWPGDG